MRRRNVTSLVGILLTACLILTSLPVLAADREITVMTYNIYQGTELDNTLAARNLLEFIVGAAQDFMMMRQTNFAERAQSLADQIEETDPDLIALQEVALWRTRFPSNPNLPATTVDSDFLQILLDALSQRRLHYAMVSGVTNFDVQSPALFSFGLMDVRLTDRNVILARTERRGHLNLTNPRGANFTTNLVIQTVAGQVTVLEGWASIDVDTRVGSFRFITTHLDAFAPPIRLAQDTEILHGPANTSLPVVLMGDMNTTSSTSTYAAFIGAGLTDVWAHVRSGEPGFTCCQVLPTIRNPVSTLSERIDLALVRGALEAEEIEIVGARSVDRTPSGLWPSDHAGIVTRVSLEERGQ